MEKRHNIRMTLGEFERHPYRYVDKHGKPRLLTMDDETGATILALVTLEEDPADMMAEAYAMA